jgi:hypothetical protein
VWATSGGPPSVAIAVNKALGRDATNGIVVKVVTVSLLRRNKSSAEGSVRIGCVYRRVEAELGLKQEEACLRCWALEAI